MSATPPDSAGTGDGSRPRNRRERADKAPSSNRCRRHAYCMRGCCRLQTSLSGDIVLLDHGCGDTRGELRGQQGATDAVQSRPIDSRRVQLGLAARRARVVRKKMPQEEVARRIRQARTGSAPISTCVTCSGGLSLNPALRQRLLEVGDAGVRHSGVFQADPLQPFQFRGVLQSRVRDLGVVEAEASQVDQRFEAG